jgi:fatty-acyl-CoA synthase
VVPHLKALLKALKDFGIKGVQAWGMTETSPLVPFPDCKPMHANYQKTKNKHSAKQGTAFQV